MAANIGPGGGYTTTIHTRGDTLFCGNYEHFTLTNTDPDAGTLYRSSDHGATWVPSNTGLTGGVPNSFANGDTYLFVSTDTHGIFRSADNGVTWEYLPASGALGSNRLLYVDGALYVGTVFKGVYKSTDNGKTYVQTSNGLPINNPFGVLISTMANVGSTLFVGVTTFGSYPHGIFRSTDGGANWMESNNGMPQPSVGSLEVKGNTIFHSNQGLDFGGIYKSTDLGVTWTLSNSGITGTPEALHAAGDGSLYTSVFLADYSGRAVFRSVNDGATWTRTGPGIPFTEATIDFASIGGEVF